MPVTPDGRLAQLRRRDLAWNTPLSTAHADRLLGHLRLSAGDRILELGCGWGGLLLRAVARTPGASAQGVDNNPDVLDRGRRHAEELGLAERVSFIAEDAKHFPAVSGRLICIGASHAWGGTDAALSGFRDHLSPRGLGLFGDGFWLRSPSTGNITMFGELAGSLAALVEKAVAAGLGPLYVDCATEAEWDDFEWTGIRGLEEFARDAPDDPLAKRALVEAETRRAEYLQGYRGVLGFAYLIVTTA
ncbi:MAG: methyltransferase domain-containing protein [Thermoplasmata archaeon]|nr:methyltransferase domain-containing protein [Thermoplasmata archaeon]